MEMSFFSDSMFKGTIAKILAVIFVFVFITSGCMKSEPPKTKEEILQFDPDFANVLAKKSQLDTEISTLHRQFNQDKAIIDTKITALQDELRALNQRLNSSIKDVRAQLDPERNAIITQINEVKETLRTKRDSLVEVEKMSSSAQELSKKGETPTQEDKEKWDKMMPVLNEEIKRLRQEIYDLRIRLDYLNSELKLLRQ